MKPFKFGDVEVDESLKDWEIVNEVGVGRWIGRVVAENTTHARTVDLQPALEMCSPARQAVLFANPLKGGGPQAACVGGFNATYVLEQPSAHRIRDIAYSSRQRCSEMSEDLRLYCFNMIADTVVGEKGPDGKRAPRH